MLKIFSLFIITLLYVNAFSQIGGLSASKIGAKNTETVSAGSIEFEPYFAYAIATKFFESSGASSNLFSSSDSTLIFSSMGLRFSYGLFENLELGIAIPIDISEINFGMKYQIPMEGKLRMGLMAGYNDIIGNRVYVRRNAAHEVSPSYIVGIIMSYAANLKLSIDFDAQFQQHTFKNTLGHTQGLYINSDIGYYFLEKINFIAGLAYNFQVYDSSGNNSHVLTLNTGISIEKAKNFILVVNAPFDLIGKNEYKTKGFGLALTIILD